MWSLINCCNAVYDSSVKEPSGIEYGDTYQFGSFDECLGAFHRNPRQEEHNNDGAAGSPSKEASALRFAGQATFNAQYCLADVTLQGYTIGAMSSRDHQFKVC